MTRLLLPEAFGVMALVSSLLSAYILLSDIGIVRSIIRDPEGEDPHFLQAAWTVQLLRAVLVAGAILAGGDETAVAAVDRYATHLGLAFQIVDDILDVEGDAADLGKSAGKDADARKLTYPSVHGLDRSRVLAAEAGEAAREALATAGLAGRLAEIADWVVSRSR